MSDPVDQWFGDRMGTVSPTCFSLETSAGADDNLLNPLLRYPTGQKKNLKIAPPQSQIFEPRLPPMSVWIDRILLAALILVVAALAVTSLPSLGGETLLGRSLLAHMMASGFLVIGLPIFAIAFLRHFSARQPTSGLQNWGVLATIATGLLAIVTVFLCMLPIPSTHQMHVLMSAHGWAGFAMIPAIIVLLLGRAVYTISIASP